MRRTRRPQTRRLSFDTLENRLVLSAVINFLDLDGNNTPDLQIIGDDGKQAVKIIDDADGNVTTISLDANGDGDFTDPDDLDGEELATSFQIFDIRLNGGNDVFEYSGISDYNAPLGSHRDVIPLMGDGKDTVKLNFLSDISADSVVEVHADLGTGNNVCTGFFDISGPFNVFGVGRFNVNAGEGNNVVRMDRGGTRGSTIDGQLDFDLGGAGGNDKLTVDFGSSNALGMSASALVKVRTHGDDGDDKAFVNLRNTGGSSGEYNVRMDGNNGSDQLFFSIFDDSLGSVSYTGGSVTLDGGIGKDQGFHSSGQNAPVTRLNLEG